MNIEIYRKTFKTIDENKHRDMVAKACAHMSTGSKKLRSVHISPVTVEQCTGYAMEVNHSSDRCIRLTFTKAYTSKQRAAMYAEIRTLAKARLDQSISTDHEITDTQEPFAFVEALRALVNLHY